MEEVEASACEQMFLLVIPNEVRNLSEFETHEKQGFLGTQRASESRDFDFSAI
jgi:hypothetical protein